MFLQILIAVVSFGVGTALGYKACSAEYEKGETLWKDLKD